MRSKAPERPKLGPLVPVIDAILEADKTALPKQRHTAKRIFERLRIEHGYAFGYTVVKDYVRRLRQVETKHMQLHAHASTCAWPGGWTSGMKTSRIGAGD